MNSSQNVAIIGVSPRNCGFDICVHDLDFESGEAVH